MLTTKEYSQVDDNGFWIDTIRLRFDEESIPNPAPEGYFEANRPEGFIQPKWENDDWVEGLTQEESKPSENELIKQEQEMLAMAVMELSTFMLNGGK